VHIGRWQIHGSLIRFLVVGLCAFGVEYGSFYGFYASLHWRLYIANSISFILGLITSFTLNRLWTFKSSDAQYHKKAAHQFSYYAVLAAINFLLTNLIVEGLVSLSLNAQIAKLVAMVTTSLWNYFLFKFIIFNHQSS
jgi:putative flippase GtrA